MSEPSTAPALLELPPTPLASPPPQQGVAERLRRTLEAHSAMNETESCSVLDLFASNYSQFIDESLSFKDGDDAHVERSPGPQQVERRPPRKLQIDWCEQSPGWECLKEEARRALRRVHAKSAKLLLLAKSIQVTSVFSGDWGRGLADEQLGIDGEIQQLLLPTALVQEDEERLARARDKIVEMARKYLQKLQHSEVSLTRATMQVPCVWNLGIVERRVSDLAEKEQQIPETASSVIAEPSSRRLRGAGTAPDQSLVKDLEPSGEERTGSTTSLQKASRNTTEALDETEPGLRLAVLDEASPLGTDYFLSDSFLKGKWSKPPDATPSEPEEDALSVVAQTTNFQELLQKLARPALWHLVHKKLLRVDKMNFPNALSRISLKKLETIIFQHYRVVEAMSLNPSVASTAEIMEACANFRQAAWLHTLRMVSIGDVAAARNGGLAMGMRAKFLSGVKYKLLLGVANWKDLLNLLGAAGLKVNQQAPSIAAPEVERAAETGPGSPPSFKKLRSLRAEQAATPVRVICSVRFLENDELLDELCTEHRIFFVERELSPPIDILVDERNCICVLDGDVFQIEARMRNFVFSLARQQVQFQKCWIMIALHAPTDTTTGELMTLFLAALVQFRVEIQVFSSFSHEETSQYIRAIVDECAEIALIQHRILPRMWFERPFLLEEESQFELFLVSTKVINHYSAQSLLHKISVADLLSSRSIDDLKPVVQNAITDEQLELLWGILHQDHGLNTAGRRMI